jgi:hypothetical protein
LVADETAPWQNLKKARTMNEFTTPDVIWNILRSPTTATNMSFLFPDFVREPAYRPERAYGTE